jgi:hypothetical protein
VITPEVEARSSGETTLMVYAVKMGVDMFIRAVLVTYITATQENAVKNGIVAKGNIDKA